MSANAVYAALRQAGASIEEAMVLTAIAGPESSWSLQATASTPRERSIGWFQVNLHAHAGASIPGTDQVVNEANMRDPRLSSIYALHLLRRAGGPRDWSVTGIPGTPLRLTPSHIEAAASAASTFGDEPADTGQIWRSATGGAPIPEGSTLGEAVEPGEGGGGPGNDTYPPGGQLFRTEDGTFVLRYRIRPRVFMEYSVSDVASLRNSGYRTRDADRYRGVGERQHLVTYDQAGDAAELANLPEGQTLQEVVNEAIDEYFPPWHPGRRNPELVAVVARIVATPGVGDATIESWIAQTTYGAEITQARSEWNNMNPVEREQAIEEQAESIQDIWWQLTGTRVDFDDARLQRWARRVANGRMTILEVGRRIEGIAGEDPESPFSRATRDELIEQGAFAANVENTIGALRSLASRWGVQMDPEALARWANDIQMNTHTQEDYLEYLRDTAAVLYPTKTSREMATIDWANPWMSTLSRVLETGTPDLHDPRIQQALQNGTTVFEFERQLMQDPAWQETGNARDRYTGVVSELSRQMGFA